MNRSLLSLVSCLAFMAGLVSAQQPPRANLIESYRRQDPTGRGSFHRFGLFRELENSNSLAAQAGLTDEQAEEKSEWFQDLGGILSAQARANSMFFASDNIFNTENNEERDIQFAQFAGVSLDAQFTEKWKLATSYDHAWFWHGKGQNAANDFITSTARQALSYERFLFNNKAALTVPLSWQFSRLFNRGSGDRTLDTWSYGAALEFSWFYKSWMIPTLSYQYSYQDSGSPQGPVPDKHKHDINLGVTFIPIEGTKFFIIPSVQYTHEQFFGVQRRRDNAWTPTLTASWQPLDFLAFDAVGSYTDSDSTLRGASFKALTGTLFARIFFNW